MAGAKHSDGPRLQTNLAPRQRNYGVTWLGALLAIVAFWVLLWDLMADRGGTVHWGQLTVATTECSWGSCASIGEWASDDGAIRVVQARLERQYPIGEKVRAGVRSGGLDGDIRPGASLFTESSLATRTWVLLGTMLVTLALALALVVGELRLGRRPPERTSRDQVHPAERT